MGQRVCQRRRRFSGELDGFSAEGRNGTADYSAGAGLNPQISIGCGFLEVKLLDPITDLVAVQAEQPRRAGLVPAGALERLDDQRSFELFEVDARRRQLDAVGELPVA